MGKNVKVDIKELRAFQQQVGEMQENYDAVIESIAKEIVARLLGKVTKRTPVGQYPSGSGKTGGTLRRAWKSSNRSINVRKMVGMYEVEVINPVQYADYVEKGHRTRGGKSWVPGRFFLKFSEEEIQAIAPALVQKRIEQKLKEMMR